MSPVEGKEPEPAPASAKAAPADAETARTDTERPGWRLRRRSRWSWLEIAFWLLPIPLFLLFPLRLPFLTEVAILALFALSLDLVLGYAGIVSLGHAAFFGVGAYTAGVLAVNGWGEPITGLLAAGAVATLVGFVSSFLVLRGSDLTRLMVTLGIAMMLLELANQMAWLTGGADGLYGVTMWPIFGVFEFDLYGQTAYWYSMIVLFLCFVAIRTIVNAPFGLALRGVKGNPLRMRAVGAPVNRHLVVAFTIGAGFAGIAGGLLAQATQFVSLDVLSFARSADGLLVLVIGGSGAVYGGVVGAIVFKFFHEWLSDITPQYWQFWLGAGLVLLVLFARGGVIGLYRALVSRFGRDRGGSA